MSDPTRFPILEKLGLSEGEARIFALLLESGTTKARDIVTKSGIGRGNVYNILNQLEAKGLILAISGKQTQYQAVDPSRLKKLMDKKKEETKRLEAEFSESLDSMSSLFNLSTGRPAIQVFEGIEGGKQAIADSISSGKEILTYLDTSAVTGLLAEANSAYVKKRIALGIQKRIIVSDSPEARDFFAKQHLTLTEVRFVKNFPTAFKTAMQIYNNTVSYITLTPEKQISILIQDQQVYEMHRQQFEFLWDQASGLDSKAI